MVWDVKGHCAGATVALFVSTQSVCNTAARKTYHCIVIMHYQAQRQGFNFVWVLFNYITSFCLPPCAGFQLAV